MLWHIFWGTDQWEREDCSFCPEQFDQITCSTCAIGYYDYPNCLLCDVENDCNGQASDVTSDGNECICTCKNQWTGSSCEDCPELYSNLNFFLCV